MPAKSRRKGPAHQNTFAFKHNPNSKRTAKILAMPIAHVCRRCHDKLEWRKQYRKYKPRTQPGKCNACQMKRVTAAYHTLCEPCTRTSSKAKTLLEEWNTHGPPSSVDAEPENETKKEDNESEEKEETNENPANVDEKLNTNEQNEMVDDANVSAANEEHNNNGVEDDDDVPRKPRVYRRICAMCAKEPALQHEGDDDEEEDNAEIEKLKNLDRPLRLRERKRLERFVEKKTSSSRRQKQEENEDDDGKEEDDDDVQEEEEEEDPLVQAVGGADQLLTGEAYQAKLLQQANQA